jgi:hypothetical protein
LGQVKDSHAKVSITGYTLSAVANPKLTDFYSYEALGLLSSIPLASSSRGPKGKGVAGQDEDLEESLITGYGRIVRDEAGTVIDIILPEENEEEEENDEESRVEKKVEAKTAIAKSTLALPLSGRCLIIPVDT